MTFRSDFFGVPNTVLPGMNWALATAATVFDDLLWLFTVQGQKAGVVMKRAATQFALYDQSGKPIGIQSGGLTHAPNWSTSEMVIPNVNPQGGVELLGAAAVSLGETLYYLWLEPSQSSTVLASACVGGDWQTPLTLLTSIGYGSTALTGQPWATPFGSDTIIVIASPATGVGASGGYVASFNVNDIDLGNGTWPARSDCFTGVASNSSVRVSGDWYPTTSLEGDLAFSFFYSRPQVSTLDTAIFAIFPVSADGTLDGSDASNWQLGVPADSTVRRDPAGRLRVHTVTNRGWDPGVPANLDVGTFATFAPPDTSVVPALPYTAGESVQVEAVPPINFDAAGTFFTDLVDASAVTCQDSQGNSHAGYSYPVYEWFFTNVSFSSVGCQVNLYATAESYPDIVNLSPQPQPSLSEVITVSGIVDGPIPLPNQNIADHDFGSGDTEFGNVDYSVTKEGTVTHTVENSFSVGIKSSQTCTKGIAPEWDIAVSGGMGFVHSTVVSTSEVTSLVQKSVMDGQTQRPNQAVLPAGLLACSGIVIAVDTSRFIDADGTIVGDPFHTETDPPQAPLYATTTAIYKNGLLRSYIPYAVIPGDLSSYTPEGWNAKMSSYGYGNSYFYDVIHANAYSFGDDNCIEVSWTPTGESSQAFETVTQHVTENSWHLDVSAYIGVGGGGGIDFFGMGEEMNWEVLIGGEYSHTSTATTESGTGWGIDVAAGYGPPQSTDPSAISAYTFRLYFLPPPQQVIAVGPHQWAANAWTLELIDCLKQSTPPSPRLPYPPLDPQCIDPGGAAWKICFVVTDYQTVDNQHYHYTGPGAALARGG
jgi:hypothetical protein